MKKQKTDRKEEVGLKHKHNARGSKAGRQSMNIDLISLETSVEVEI